MNREPAFGEDGWVHGDEVRAIMRSRAKCIPTFQVKAGDSICLWFQPGQFRRVLRVRHLQQVEFVLQDLAGVRDPEMENANYGAFAWVALN